MQCFIVDNCFFWCLMCIRISHLCEIQELPLLVLLERRLLLIVAAKEFGMRMFVWAVIGSLWRPVRWHPQDLRLLVGHHVDSFHTLFNLAHWTRIYVARLIRLLCRSLVRRRCVLCCTLWFYHLHLELDCFFSSCTGLQDWFNCQALSLESSFIHYAWARSFFDRLFS